MLKRFFSSYTKLGRWKIVHDTKIINIKIDQANKDNNGTTDYKDTPKEKSKEEEDKFLIPYCL